MKKTRPYSPKPQTNNLSTSPEKCVQSCVPCSLSLDQGVDRQAGNQPAPEPQPLELPLARGQKMEGITSLLSPVPDSTHAHARAHTHLMCVPTMVLCTQGCQYSPRPASLREGEKEVRPKFRPLLAHFGHHSPRRRCYKTWYGVCDSDGHACGYGTAPSLVTVFDVENVKTHSSPLQRMGSALHTDMYRCHGVPGTSAGRVYDHGCQEGSAT